MRRSLVLLSFVAACSRTAPHDRDVVAARSIDAAHIADAGFSASTSRAKLVVTPATQSVTLLQDMSPNMNDTFCLQQAAKLSATIRNDSAAAFYAPAASVGSIGIAHFQRDGKDVLPFTVPAQFTVSPRTVQMNRMQLVRPGEEIHFVVGVCSVNADTAMMTAYPIAGPGGAYTFSVFYAYDGPDYVDPKRGAVRAPTLHDMLVSSEITVHVN